MLNYSNNIAVCGAGTMGPSIAQIFAYNNYNVTLYDINKESLNLGKSIIESNLNLLKKEKIIDIKEVNKTLDNIEITNKIEDIKDVSLLIECITENKDVKKTFFQKIDNILKEDTFIASNTSYLNIFEIMPKRRLANSVITHWFAPAHIIPLVEVVKGENTTKDTLDYFIKILKKIGKTPILLNKFVPGFCINRIQRIIGREVFFQLDNDIISAEDLDLAVKASIIPRAMILGLVQRYDFTGLDLSANNLKNPDYLEPPIDNYPKSLTGKVKEGKLGVKTGEGFYKYNNYNLEEILTKRDKELIRIFRENKDLLEERI